MDYRKKNHRSVQTLFVNIDIIDILRRTEALEMPLINLIKNFRDNYMRSSIEKMNFPEFPADEERRYQIFFSGIVQGVGFRYEAWLIAEKLGLTGFAENLPNGDVYVEIQGPKNKILHFIHCMESIKRISIEQKTIDELPLKEETAFIPVY